jgi:hypothetical protein
MTLSSFIRPVRPADRLFLVPIRMTFTKPFQESKLLSTLLNEALNNSTYRDNARKFQKAIVKANGLSVAADLVEQSLRVTKEAGKA